MRRVPTSRTSKHSICIDPAVRFSNPNGRAFLCLSVKYDFAHPWIQPVHRCIYYAHGICMFRVFDQDLCQLLLFQGACEVYCASRQTRLLHMRSSGHCARYRTPSSLLDVAYFTTSSSTVQILGLEIGIEKKPHIKQFGTLHKFRQAIV